MPQQRCLVAGPQHGTPRFRHKYTGPGTPVPNPVPVRFRFPVPNPVGTFAKHASKVKGHNFPKPRVLVAPRGAVPAAPRVAARWVADAMADDAAKGVAPATAASSGTLQGFMGFTGLQRCGAPLCHSPDRPLKLSLPYALPQTARGRGLLGQAGCIDSRGRVPGRAQRRDEAHGGTTQGTSRRGAARPPDCRSGSRP